MPDVLHELSPQVGHRREYTARNDVALDLGKPQFDLVEPGGIGRSEMQVNLWMSSQKVVDLSRLMGGEVVGNHVDLFAARLVDDDVRQQQLTTTGALFWRWRGDVKAIYYTMEDGSVFDLPVSENSGGLVAGVPRLLFKMGTSVITGGFFGRGWDAARDGQHFIVASREQANGSLAVIVTNWPARLKK